MQTNLQRQTKQGWFASFLDERERQRERENMEREMSPHDASGCGRREQAGMRITSECAAANSREKEK
jgi:hypothetical protein